MKVSRKIFVALIGSIALAIGVVTPAHATTTIKYVNCSGMPAHVASMEYQNSPGDLLYVKAAGAAQLKIHTYTLTVTAPGVRSGYASAASNSLNVPKSKQYCNPN